MKKVLVLLSLLVLCSAVYADNPVIQVDKSTQTITYSVGRVQALRVERPMKSSNITVNASGVRLIYLADHEGNSIALGSPIWAKGKLHIDWLGIVRPSDGTQIAAGAGICYDWTPLWYVPLTFSPLVGIKTDITNAPGSGRMTGITFGIEAKIGF